MGSTALSNTALLVVEQPCTDTKPAPTPFEAFLAAVVELHSLPTVRTNRGAVFWEGHPVVGDISSGLFLYGMKVARDRKMPYHTTDQIHQLMEEINAVMDVGLVVRFQNMEQAAQAYKQEVTDKIMQAIREHGLRPGMKIPGAALKMFIKQDQATMLDQMIQRQQVDPLGSWQSLWQFASAFFFVRLESHAREKIDQLNEALAQITKANWLYQRGRRLLLTSAQIPEARPSGSHALSSSGTFDFPNARSEQALRDWFEGIDDQMEEIRHRQQAFRELPIDLRGIPKDALEVSKYGETKCGPDTIAEGWLTTQLLLSVLEDEEDRHFLKAEQYLQALNVFEHGDPEVLWSHFESRLRSLKSDLSERAWKEVRRFVKWQIPQVKGWYQRADIYMHARAFVSIPYESLMISGEDALQVAIGEAQDLEYSSRVHQPGQEALRKNIMEAIDWSEVTLEELGEMISSEVLPPPLIVQGIARISSEKREAYLDLFLLQADISRDVFQALLQERILRLNTGLVEEYCAEIPEDDLEAWLKQMVVEDDALTVHASVIALLKLPSSKACAILEDVPHRAQWISFLIAEIWSKQDALKHLSSEEYRQFIEHVGSVYWQKSILVLEMLEREVAYKEERVKPGEICYRAPWNRMTIEESGSFNFREVFGMRTNGELEKLIAKHPEEDLLCWYHANEAPAVILERLKIYKQNRADYYAFALGE